MDDATLEELVREYLNESGPALDDYLASFTKHKLLQDAITCAG